MPQKKFEELPPSVARTYVVLAGLPQEKLEQTREALGRNLGISRATLCEHIRQLEDAGMLVVDRTSGGPGALTRVILKPIKVAGKNLTIHDLCLVASNSSGATTSAATGLSDSTMPSKNQMASDHVEAYMPPPNVPPSGELPPKRIKHTGGAPLRVAPAHSAEPVEKSPERAFKKLDGSKLSPFQLRLTACQLDAGDMQRLLDGERKFRDVFLSAVADVLRSVYVMRWCSAHKRQKSSWKDTDRSKLAFLRASEVWIGEFIARGLHMERFLDAAEEMAPKSLRYPTVDYLGGGYLRDGIHAWLLPAERGKADGVTIPAITMEDTESKVPLGEIKRAMFKAILTRNWPGLWNKNE